MTGNGVDLVQKICIYMIFTKSDNGHQQNTAHDYGDHNGEVDDKLVGCEWSERSSSAGPVGKLCSDISWRRRRQTLNAKRLRLSCGEDIDYGRL